MSTYVLENLKKIRLSKGWSQISLSQMSGLSLRTIQRVESGNPASLETAKSLAATFELKGIDSLVGIDPLKSQHIKKKMRPQAVIFQSPEHDFNMNLFATFVLIGVVLFFKQEVFLFIERLMPISMFDIKASIEEITENKWLTSCGGIIFILAILKAVRTPLPSRNTKEYYEKRRPTRFPFFYTTTSLSHKDYYRNYHLNERDVPIGTALTDSLFNKERLICHQQRFISRGTLMIGEEGSGIDLAAIGQYFELLCLQGSGLFMIDNKASTIFPYIQDVLQCIDRKGDFIEICVQDLHNKDVFWWEKVFTEQRLIFCVTNSKNSSLNKDVLNVFFEAINNNKTYFYESQSFPMLVLDDGHIPPPNKFKENISSARSAGMRCVLLVKNPQDFTQRDTGTLSNYFDHKYLMKIHDPKIIKSIFAMLSIDDYDDALSVSDVLSHGPGESSYLHHHLVWPKVRLRYLYEKKLSYKKKKDLRC